MKSQNEVLENPRVIIIQKLYSNHFNKDTTIVFPKHRFRKFIKDVVNGTIERHELINALMEKELSREIKSPNTELMVKLMIMAAIYEFMFMHKTPTKVVINEYIKVADFFVQNSQKAFLNAILDKLSKIARVESA